jgi:hypothetical protein
MWGSTGVRAQVKKRKTTAVRTERVVVVKQVVV